MISMVPAVHLTLVLCSQMFTFRMVSLLSLVLGLDLQRAGSMPAGGALPEPLILSSEMLDEGGMYLLDSGADLLLYVDQAVDDHVVQVGVLKVAQVRCCILRVCIMRLDSSPNDVQFPNLPHTSTMPMMLLSLTVLWLLVAVVT